MKYLRSSKKVKLNFEEIESEISIGKISLVQTTSKETCSVGFSFFKTDERGVLKEFKNFTDIYDRQKVNSLTEDLISTQSEPIGLFDLNELLMLEVSKIIIDEAKDTNKYLGISASDLTIIEA